jgi:hypothetical protein
MLQCTWKYAILLRCQYNIPKYFPMLQLLQCTFCYIISTCLSLLQCTWKYATPLVLSVLLLLSWRNFGHVGYNGVEYPAWVQVMGYLITGEFTQSTYFYLR